MPQQVLAIARNAFVESLRQPIFFILVALSGILQVFNTWGTAFSMGYSSSAEVSGDDKLLLDIGMATVFVCGTLLAAFIATAVISREIEDKTILTVVSKPIPRPVVVIGKFLGVSAAIILAVITMVLFLFMAIRHGVMSTAADRPDQPVILFSTLAVLLSIAVAAWCNFYYGWSFPQLASVLMLPAMAIAYGLVILFDKEWKFQPFYEVSYWVGGHPRTEAEYARMLARGDAPPRDDPQLLRTVKYLTFKPQIAMACAAMSMAIMVLTSVAVAVSTRLGQVMTIVVCAGVFFVGLISNHAFGRHAYQNRHVAVVQEAEPVLLSRREFRADGDRYLVLLERAPEADLPPGTPFFYGPSPNGFGLTLRSMAQDGTIGVFVLEADDRRITIENRGNAPVSRPPETGDFVFPTPTRVSPVPAAIHGLIPNMQHFWLVDAVTQNNPIPISHLASLALYALLLISVFLALGIALFQRRDVG
ncbi:MAG: ABC transporter permease subunit [Phycisphaeraceae bacterium]|nr:ABC transporter permease subunit [Phycisphaeraceae bacterium]